MSEPTANALPDLALKGAILLAAAWLITAALRRSSAATRHLIWLAAITSLLALPLLSAVLPPWKILPAWETSYRATVTDMPTWGTLKLTDPPPPAIMDGSLIQNDLTDAPSKLASDRSTAAPSPSARAPAASPIHMIITAESTW